MSELLSLPLLSVGLTLLAYWIGHTLQKKLKLSILSPIVVGAVLVLLTMKLTGLPMAQYQQSMKVIDWLLTPATVCLAVPMYEHFRTLRKNFPVVVVSVISGCSVCSGLACWRPRTMLISSAMIFGFALVFGFDGALTVSLLPKSVTTAIGVSLSELNGGIPSVTTAAIALTGNLAAIIGPGLCKLFRLTDPVAQGVAFGTSGHVVGTSKAAELGDLQAAAGSLSLVTAGVCTAIVFPWLAQLVL